MNSRLLFNKKTLELVKIQPEPDGSAPIPSFNTLCKSADIENKEEYNSLVLNFFYPLDVLQKRFFISKTKEGFELKEKQIADISYTYKKIDSKYLLNLKIHSSEFEIFIFKFKDKMYSIDLKENKGSKEFLVKKGEYKLVVKNKELRDKEIIIKVQ